MLIIINGTMNSGKTTVAKILKEKIPRVAHVEKMRQFIEWMSIEESIPYNIQNLVCITGNFLRGDLNVIVSYPISNEHFKLFEKEAADLGKPIFAFTLSPRLEVVTKNRGERELKDWEIKRIQKEYKEGINEPDYGIIIDNSNQTPKETADLIISKINI